MSGKFTGINIQFPISQEILSGKKTVETRTYPIPNSYLGKTLLLVETPGKSGKFKARIAAKIRFKECFLYPSKAAFYRDQKRHLVEAGSAWAWKDKAKWGWVIESVVPVVPRPAGKIGIKYTLGMTLD